MKFESKFGLGEIVIRESHQNGKLVQERMMEVIAITVERRGDKLEYGYVCEDTLNGHRQMYSEDMLVGDPDYDQDKSGYIQEIDPNETNRTEV